MPVPGVEAAETIQFAYLETVDRKNRNKGTENGETGKQARQQACGQIDGG